MGYQRTCPKCGGRLVLDNRVIDGKSHHVWCAEDREFDIDEDIVHVVSSDVYTTTEDIAKKTTLKPTAINIMLFERYDLIHMSFRTQNGDHRHFWKFKSTKDRIPAQKPA